MSAIDRQGPVLVYEVGLPVVYGDAERVVVLVEGLTRLVERQPIEVLADPGVTGSLRRLVDVTRGLLAGGPGDGHVPVRDRWTA